ncbi:MAG: flagellar biosynthesis protein FlhB [Candidatus Saganbacteria bacterium]|nr:flagellar biosynthesis protein FlhB [Candidatus Saganbacteria bacterium]
MGEQGGDKSEEPTPHRLREAREKGQVAKSKEITTAFLLLTSYVIFRYTGDMIWRELAGMTQSVFQLIPNISDFSLDFVGSVLLIALRAFAISVTPIFIVTVIVALLAEALQTGFVAAVDPLSPKLERINPLEGFKRMFSMTGFVELVKSIIKILIVFYITWYAVKDDLPSVIGVMSADPWQSLVIGGSIAYKIAIRVGIFYLAVAILDYFYRRWEYMKNLKMTKQEIKEEYKRLEGDPQVKQRMRDLQRAMSNQRMMAAVPGADVVVTNPTHLAVAILYDASRMKAPSLVAKGRHMIAEEIKKIAESNNIPVIENEPLARSIFNSTKVGQEISSEIYQAVAEILAFVYKIKKNRLNRKKEWLGPLKGIRAQKTVAAPSRR